MNLVPGAMVPTRNIKVPQDLHQEFVIVFPVVVVRDWPNEVRFDSPRVNRVWESKVVKLVANIDAETFRQSEQ